MLALDDAALARGAREVPRGDHAAARAELHRLRGMQRDPDATLN